MAKMKYIFKSTFQEYSKDEIDVNINDSCYEFFVDGVSTVINCDSKVVSRIGEEFEMEFDLNNEIGRILIKGVNQNFEFDLQDIKFENKDGVDLSFKYYLEDQLVEIEISLK